MILFLYHFNITHVTHHFIKWDAEHPLMCPHRGRWGQYGFSMIIVPIVLDGNAAVDALCNGQNCGGQCPPYAMFLSK